MWLLASAALVSAYPAAPQDPAPSTITLGVDGPPKCPPSTPGPAGKNKCSLAVPTDPEFADICHPGATGHAGGAEQPAFRCPGVNYGDGVFRCACCGAPLFYAQSKFEPPGDGWPAFHGNGSFVDTNGTWVEKGNSTVCTPGGTEVVCSTCGSHLGDYFAAGVLSSYAYYCVDGVCLLPPGAPAGHVCQPKPSGPSPSKAKAYKALREMLRERGKSEFIAALQGHD